MMPRFITILRLGLGAVLLLAALFPAAGSRQRQDIQVRIGLLEYGDAFNNQVQRQPLVRSGSGQSQLLPIQVTNTSNRDLDFFMDGNSWGDGTLTVIVTTSGNQVHRIHCGTRAYSRNFPEIVRLKPGETWVRNIDYSLRSWNEIQQVLTGNSVQVSAEIVQRTPLKSDPNLWIGDESSPNLTVPVS